MGQSLLTHSLEVEAQAYTQPVSRRKTKAPAPAGADVLLFAEKLERHAAILSTTTPNVSTHFHEVGHLIGLGHVGTRGTTNVHNDNSPTAYGVTLQEMQDVMGDL